MSSDSFVREAREDVRELADGVLELEGESAPGEEHINELFRTAHSLKGTFGMEGHDGASELAHAIEDLLAAVRAGRLTPDATVVDRALEATDRLEAMMDEIEREGTTGIDPDGVAASLRDAVEAASDDADADGAVPEVELPDAPAEEMSAEEALEAASEFDDLDALLAQMDDEPEALGDFEGGGAFDGVPGSDSESDDPSAGGTVDDDSDAGRAGTDADVDGTTGAAGTDDAAAGGDADAAGSESGFAEMKAEVESKPDVAELQSEIDEVSFGEFDEDDDMSIQELVEIEPSEEEAETEAEAETEPATGTGAETEAAAEAADVADDTDKTDTAGAASEASGADATEPPGVDTEPGAGTDAQTETAGDVTPVPESPEGDAPGSGGTQDTADTQAGSEPDDAGVEAGDAPSAGDDDAAAGGESGFAEMKAEVESEPDVAELQSEIDEVSFGEFDDDDDMSIQELVEIEPSEAGVETEAEPATAAGVETGAEAEAEPATEAGVETEATDAADDTSPDEADEADEAVTASEGDEPDEADAAASPDVGEASTEVASADDPEAATDDAGTGTEPGGVNTSADAGVGENADASAGGNVEADADGHEAVEADTDGHEAVEADADADGLEDTDGHEAVEADFDDVTPATEAGDTTEDAVPDVADVFEDDEDDLEEALSEALDGPTEEVEAAISEAFDDRAGETFDETTGETVENRDADDKALTIDTDLSLDPNEPIPDTDDSLDGDDAVPFGTDASVGDEEETAAVDAADAVEEDFDEDVAIAEDLEDIDLDALEFGDPAVVEGETVGGFERDEGVEEFESRFRDLFDRGLGDGDAVVPRQAAATLEESVLPTRQFRSTEPESRIAPNRRIGDVQTITVDVEYADDLLAVAERISTGLQRLPDTGEASGIRSELEAATRELRRTVMNLRLMPLRTVTNRLDRVVRDVAREAGKEAELEVEGQDVELDRSIIDRIGDPVVHLVRNAVDHGIETPEEREAAGKPRTGTVEVRARQSGEDVVIEIEDDGRGVDIEAIREEAIEEGVVTAGEAGGLDDDGVYDLLFHPGLSTRTEVTETSGRGVGMDVVKETAEALNGTVDVESDPGEGTLVRLTLPVSVAVAEVLVVEAGGARYAVPTESVEQVGRAGGSEIVGGGLLSADSDRALDLAAEMGQPTEGGQSGRIEVHVRRSDGRLAIRCDRIHQTTEAVITPYDDLLADVPGIGGAMMADDGRLINVIDVEGL